MKKTRDIRLSDEELVELLVTNGKPYISGWFDDGDGESGPTGGRIFGIRLGEVHMTTSENGMGRVGEWVFIECTKHEDVDPCYGIGGYPMVFRQIRSESLARMLRLYVELHVRRHVIRTSDKEWELKLRDFRRLF